MVKIRLSVAFVFFSRKVGRECACWGDDSMALRQAFIDLGQAGVRSYYGVAPGRPTVTNRSCQLKDRYKNFLQTYFTNYLPRDVPSTAKGGRVM
eukprot:IDg4918t1